MGKQAKPSTSDQQADQAGVEEAAPPAPGTEPAPPAEKPTDDPEPKAPAAKAKAKRMKMQVEVMSVSERGFWRDKRFYGRKPQRFDVEAFTPKQLAKLEVEHKAKNLIVKLIEVEAA